MENQNIFSWPQNQKAAISLTYDDGYPIVFKETVPDLEAAGLRATFYIPIQKRVREHIDDWKKVAAMGHELGNHSIFHPCRKDPPENFTWVDDGFDLQYYTPKRWSDEMTVANLVLGMMDGKKERTFGNTCCQNFIGMGEKKQSIEPLAENLFVATRGQKIDKVVNPETINFNNLGHYSGDKKTFGRLKDEIEGAIKLGGWIIYMIHGVGKGSHNLFIEKPEHDKLLTYLKEQQESIWIAPMVDVANHLKEEFKNTDS